MLIIGHIDVVEAKREDWTTDPFVFTEKDGSKQDAYVADQGGGSIDYLMPGESVDMFMAPGQPPPAKRTDPL